MRQLENFKLQHWSAVQVKNYQTSSSPSPPPPTTFPRTPVHHFGDHKMVTKINEVAEKRTKQNIGSTRGWSFQCISTVREEQVWDHLMKLNSHKSMGPKEIMLPCHSIIFEKLWQSDENPVDWKNRNTSPIKKKGEMKVQGTTEQWASPLHLRRSWKQF